jgi:hypothetical protein
MARITFCVIPMIQAAESLAEQARDVLQLHRQEIPRSFSGVTASLETAIDALDRAVEQLEQGRLPRREPAVVRPRSRATRVRRAPATCPGDDPVAGAPQGRA